MTVEKPHELPAVCAWCRRVRDPLDYRWVPTDPQPTASAADPTRGTCPECFAAVTREVWQRVACARGG